MTEIRFTRDYRGKLTQEIFYVAGSVVSFDHRTATQIVAEDAAEIVEKEPAKKPQPKVEPKPEPKTSKTTTKAKAS